MLCCHWPFTSERIISKQKCKRTKINYWEEQTKTYATPRQNNNTVNLFKKEITNYKDAAEDEI